MTILRGCDQTWVFEVESSWYVLRIGEVRNDELIYCNDRTDLVDLACNLEVGAHEGRKMSMTDVVLLIGDHMLVDENA